MSGVPVIRPLTSDDMYELMAIECQAYGGKRWRYAESAAHLWPKIKEFPEGCIGCFVGGQMVGFAISLLKAGTDEIHMGEINVVKTENPDNLFIHDLAVAREHKGKGYAGLLVRQLLKVAKNHNTYTMSLSSIPDDVMAFWHRFGFRVAKILDENDKYPKLILMSRLARKNVNAGIARSRISLSRAHQGR